MSEASLWDRIRNNVGHRGHFSRIEFNPTAGYPDLSYCIKGEEGHLELKWTEKVPARETTACFPTAFKGREAQVAWIHTRVKHGGRVYIGAGIGDLIIIVPGTEVRRFDQLTYFQLGKVGQTIGPGEWDGFLRALSSPMPPYSPLRP